ncbi:MAG: hypothetical protein ACE5JD_14605 [Candidatus Methylomirabilia bacterium]
MTNSEYQRLIEFLGRRFAEMDRRFEAIDRRFVSMEQRFDGRFDAIEQQLRDFLGG